MIKRFLPFTLFIFTFSLTFGQTTTVIADWDGTDLTMGGAFGNGHFGDSLFAVVANPNPSGINMSANAQNWQKASDAATWGGFYYDLPEVIDLTGGTGKICVSVYSDHETIIRAKIEKSNDGGPDASYNMNYTTPGEWQQLCYDLLGPDVNGDANTAGYTYTRLTFFPEFGIVPATDASYFFDDITKTTGGPQPPAPVVIADWDGTDLTMGGAFGNGHFGDSLFSIVANPNPSGINMSANVQNWQKADDAATWGGFYYDLPEVISLTGAFGKVCISVMSDHETIIRAKIEKSNDGGPDASFNNTYNTPGEWQQLCYDLLGPDVNGDANTAGFTYTRLTLFPEFGTVPATNASYFFDDIFKVTGGGMVVIPGELISNYETTGVTVDMVGSFGNGHYGSDLFDVVANPSPDGGNSSEFVQEWCKADDAMTWGGWLMDVDTLDFTGTKATICYSVYADEVSLMRLKLEGSPTGPDVRLEQEYTTPGEWQRLCYDFSMPDIDDNLALGNMYFKIVFFPEFGTVPTSDKCFYFDDIFKDTDGLGFVPVFISSIIKDSPDHTILEEIINTTDLWGAVDASDVTVFAPTDAAFNALPAGQLDALTNNTDNAAFNFILFHVARGLLPSSELTMGREFIMANGYDGIVTAANSQVSNATIIEADVDNSNGVLHITSDVLDYPAQPVSYLFEDFEGDFTQSWAGFNWGSADANVWIEPNPSPDAVNSSATVLRSRKYPEDQGANDFQGIVVRDMDRRMNFFGNMTEVCVDVLFEDVDSRFRWKFEQGIIDATNLRYEASNTVAGQWEKVCADVRDASITDPFTPAANNIYPQLAIFFDYTFGGFPDVEIDYYIDNLEVYNNDIVGTQDVTELENFEMFPNPTDDVLTIKTDTPVKYALVYNASGKQMIGVVNPLDKDLNVSTLPSGIYYIQFLGENTTPLGVAKFVKQ